MKILFKRNPLLVLMGRLVSGLGSMMMSFALSLYVLDTTGSGAKFASVLALSLLPRLLLGPFAGILADRISRKKTMVAFDIISGVVTILFALMYFNSGSESLVPIYVFVIILTTLSIFFEPSSIAIVTDIVEKKDLPKYNSAVQFCMNFVNFFSPLIAGLLYGAFGIYVLVIINGISFLLSAVSEMFIKIDKESLEKTTKDSTFVKSFKEGIDFIKSSLAIKLILGLALIANLAFVPMVTVGLSYVLRQDLGVSEVMYGSAQSLMIIGSIIGTLFVTALNRKYHFLKVIAVYLTVLTILSILFSVVSIPSISLGGMQGKYIAVIIIVTGMFLVTSITSISSHTGMQKLVPNNLIGRVFSVISAIGHATIPLGQIIFGLLVDKTHSYIVIMIFAGIMLAANISCITKFAMARKQGMFPDPLPENGIKILEYRS